MDTYDIEQLLDSVGADAARRRSADSLCRTLDSGLAARLPRRRAALSHRHNVVVGVACLAALGLNTVLAARPLDNEFKSNDGSTRSAANAEADRVISLCRQNTVLL